MKAGDEGALHAGIFGPTKCGKTTLAKALCADFRAQGVNTLVCHPWDRKWDASFFTTDFDQLVEMMKKSRSCAVFIDEAGKFELTEEQADWVLTGSRNWGHVVHISGHARKQISTTMRDSFSRLFLFKSSKPAARAWEEIFVDEDILTATQLQRFEFLQIEHFEKTIKRKLDLREKAA